MILLYLGQEDMIERYEIGLPNEAGIVDILKIDSKPMSKKGEIDFESVNKFVMVLTLLN